MTPLISLALQGGGSHGAFTWGVLDRLLEEVEAGRLEIAALSGTSAGGLNAALVVSGLVQGGPAAARHKLDAFWHAVSRHGLMQGNALLFGEAGPFGANQDGTPLGLALETAQLLVSPYTNPFYRDALLPLLTEAFPADELAALNDAAGPRLFVTATNVATNARVIFSQPDLSLAALRATASLPSAFQAAEIGGEPFWDGGYLGNPALSPLLDQADDMLLVLANAFERAGMPPRTPGAIAARLNEITFNASVVLELDAVAAVNRLLAELAESGTPYAGRYRTIRTHAIRDDAFLAGLGFVSKNNVSAEFLAMLRERGRATAAAWLAAHGSDLGVRSSLDLRREMTKKLLNAPAPR